MAFANFFNIKDAINVYHFEEKQFSPSPVNFWFGRMCDFGIRPTICVTA